MTEAEAATRDPHQRSAFHPKPMERAEKATGPANSCKKRRAGAADNQRKLRKLPNGKTLASMRSFVRRGFAPRIFSEKPPSMNWPESSFY
ncbi:MAG TPA: hypothetical protein VGV37_28100 [Aliidongia sp.]|uniref:hypothetical protein n=1 Tax=Aliidongia sp. TaxID=1914230 RepID=UPI002DDDA3D4|nr:hypothetical protein [Aliidongia sp.]HEV2678423.1 hypothetical protein [Aliidongia sp.]